MLVNLEKILLGLGAIAVIALGVLITANVVMRAGFSGAVPDSVTMVRELMVAAILLPLGAATAALKAGKAVAKAFRCRGAMLPSSSRSTRSRRNLRTGSR